MPYPLTASLVLGAAKSGLTLTADLRNADGTSAAGLTTTSLIEVSALSGSYQWTGTVPDGHRGYIRFLDGATFVTHVPVEPAEVETAAVVWANASRTLTSFGTLVADIWSHATRTLTQAVSVDAAAIAAAVWSYVTRTLTLTAAQIAAILSGTDLTIHRGDTVSISFTGLGSISARTKLWFTLKSSATLTDAQATVQITEADGLIRLNGAAATAAQGSIAVNDQAAGNITVTLDEAAAALLEPGTRYKYDVQMLAGGVVTTLTSGEATVTADVTRSTA